MGSFDDGAAVDCRRCDAFRMWLRIFGARVAAALRSASFRAASFSFAISSANASSFDWRESRSFFVFKLVIFPTHFCAIAGDSALRA